MTSERAYILAALLGFSIALVSGQTAVQTINDGLDPIDDGETQMGKVVEIKCQFSGVDLQHKRGILYSIDDQSWELATKETSRQGRWNTDSYSAVEIFPGGGQAILTFTIKAAVATDGGYYKCQVYTENLDGSRIDIPSASDKKMIDIFARTDRVVLEGQTSDSKIEVVAGDTKMIRCTAYNGSKPQIDVKVNGEVKLANMTVKVVTPGREYSAEGQRVFTTEENGQQITCSAKVKTFSEALEDHANLQITAKPTITCDPMSRSAAVGSPATFTCTVDGIPLPRPEDVFWNALSDGLQVKGNEDNVDQGVQSEAKVVNNKLEVVLTVTVMATRKSDKFTLTAVNSRNIGADPVTVELLEPGTSDPATDGDGGSASALTATFSMLLLLVLHILL